MSLIQPTEKTKSEYNRLVLRRLKAQGQILDALAVIVMLFAIVVILASVFGVFWAFVTVTRWLF